MSVNDSSNSNRVGEKGVAVAIIEGESVFVGVGLSYFKVVEGDGFGEDFSFRSTLVVANSFVFDGDVFKIVSSGLDGDGVGYLGGKLVVANRAWHRFVFPGCGSMFGDTNVLGLHFASTLWKPSGIIDANIKKGGEDNEEYGAKKEDEGIGDGESAKKGGEGNDQRSKEETKVFKVFFVDMVEEFSDGVAHKKASNGS